MCILKAQSGKVAVTLLCSDTTCHLILQKALHDFNLCDKTSNVMVWLTDFFFYYEKSLTFGIVAGSHCTSYDVQKKEGNPGVFKLESVIHSCSTDDLWFGIKKHPLCTVSRTADCTQGSTNSFLEILLGRQQKSLAAARWLNPCSHWT